MNFQLIQAKRYLQAIALRSNNEQHTEHIDNALDNLIKLEQRDRQLVKMVNEKERELIKRGLRIEKLESDIRLLKNRESVLNGKIDSLESINNNLLESIEKDFDNIKSPKLD